MRVPSVHGTYGSYAVRVVDRGAVVRCFRYFAEKRNTVCE